MADFTELLFTVPKIDIEQTERAAYDRGYKDGYERALAVWEKTNKQTPEGE